MARPSTFTRAEDRILLRYPGVPAAVVNAALQAAGFEPREARQLSRRRAHLKRRPSQQAPGRESKITTNERQRLALHDELAELDARRAEVIQQLRVLDEELRRLVSELPVPSLDDETSSDAHARIVRPG